MYNKEELFEELSYGFFGELIEVEESEGYHKFTSFGEKFITEYYSDGVMDIFISVCGEVVRLGLFKEVSIN